MHKQAEIIQHRSEKDETDGELAVKLALERGAEELILCGYRGGESDHALGNLFLLALARREYPKLAPNAVSAVSETERVWYIENEKLEITGRVGEIVSILPLDSEIQVSLSGFRYEMSDGSASRGSTKSLRNEFAQESAEISVRGAALVVHQLGG